MTEYWVSQAKHYCKACNCWIADNKVNRQNHEQSVRHKKNIEQLLKQKRKDALHGARNDQELHNQLAAIEKAALASVQADKLTSSSTFIQQNSSRSSNWMNNGGAFRNEAPPSMPVNNELNNGIYSIRGKVYMDGRIFEDKLRKDVVCEIFVEEIDEWLPAVILQRNEKPVPNTTVTMKSFDVEYTVLSPEGEAISKEFEKDVRSDRLRIVSSVDKGAGYQVTEGYVPPPLPVQPVIQESTGLGGWQTVSVKVIDEQKEWEDHEAAVEAMRKEQSEIAIPENTGNEVDDSIVRGKVYKGFVIEDVAVEANFRKSGDSEVENVIFKRRKLNNGEVKSEATPNDPGPDINESKDIPKAKSKVRNIRKRDSDRDS